MRMHRQNHAVSFVQPLRAVFDLVRVDIRGIHFNGRRQIDNHRIFRIRLPDIDDRVADLYRIIRLCPRKAFRRVLEDNLPGEFLRSLLDPLRSLYRDLFDLFPVHMENNISLQR